MNRLESLKRELDYLPTDKLALVERLLLEIKKGEEMQATGECSLLTDLAQSAFYDELPADLSVQHDHYLYGVPKR